MLSTSSKSTSSSMSTLISLGANEKKAEKASDRRFSRWMMIKIANLCIAIAKNICFCSTSTPSSSLILHSGLARLELPNCNPQGANWKWGCPSSSFHINNPLHLSTDYKLFSFSLLSFPFSLNVLSSRKPPAACDNLRCRHPARQMMAIS